METPYLFRYHYSVPGPNNSLIDTYDLVSRDEFIRRSGGIDPMFDKNTMTYQTYTSLVNLICVSKIHRYVQDQIY